MSKSSCNNNYYTVRVDDMVRNILHPSIVMHLLVANCQKLERTYLQLSLVTKLVNKKKCTQLDYRSTLSSSAKINCFLRIS